MWENMVWSPFQIWNYTAETIRKAAFFQKEGESKFEAAGNNVLLFYVMTIQNRKTIDFLWEKTKNIDFRKWER